MPVIITWYNHRDKYDSQHYTQISGVNSSPSVESVRGHCPASRLQKWLPLSLHARQISSLSNLLQAMIYRPTNKARNISILFWNSKKWHTDARKCNDRVNNITQLYRVQIHYILSVYTCTALFSWFDICRLGFKGSFKSSNHAASLLPIKLKDDYSPYHSRRWTYSCCWKAL